MYKSILNISAAMYISLCLTGCDNRQTAEPAAKIIPVKVMDIGFSDHSTGLNYVGAVEESSAISLGFSGMGTVERVLVSEGERVRKGQLLAVLNGSTAQNAYDVAKSTLHQAQDAYDRLKSLHDRGSITDIQFIEVETGLEKAKAMEAIALKSVEDCSLYAPMNGVVSKRSIEEGVSVMPGVLAFKIVSIDEVYINVPVPENEIGGIKTGQTALVTVPAIGQQVYKGAVDKKGVEGNPVSRTYAVKIKTGNPGSELMPGMVCKVYLQQAETEDNKQIIIPNRSVQIAPDNQKYVWLADGNTAKRRFITVGSLSDYGIIVESGLAAGDKLIVEGFTKISEGMKIQITN